jgi:cytosine/uracil/thiamine/allantoin permease
MKKILLFILKALCYFFILFSLLIILIEVAGLDGIKHNDFMTEPLIVIVVCGAFLIWRFNAEKEIRDQRKKSKSIKYKINLKEENLSEKSIQTLVEFKELLSLGIITKEEFEKKKNDLLDLK